MTNAPSNPYFAEVAEQWDEIRSDYFTEHLRDAAIDKARLPPRAVVADVGTGTGFVAAGLASRADRVMGFDASPDSMPPGLRLDPMHAVIHLVTGLIGSYFGFRRPSGALTFLRVFTIFYLGLAIFGTFTNMHFGMQLEFEENAFHWPLSLIAGAIAFGMSFLPSKNASA